MKSLKKQIEKKSYFEVVYSSIVKIENEIKEKKELQNLILCDVQNEIFPKLEKISNLSLGINRSSNSTP